MQAAPISKDIVLVGGGHAHVFVLKAFGMNPEPGVRLTLIAKELAAPYSGMLPGFVAGHYSLEECHIDLVRLAQYAGARIIHGAMCGIDRANKRVLIGGRPPLSYDLLSIDVGITPLLEPIAGAAEHALAVKPVSLFAPKWQALEARVLSKDGPRKIAVIGGGAAGVELVLAARHRMHHLAAQTDIKPDAFSFALITGSAVLPSHNARARALAKTNLFAAGVNVVEGDLTQTVSATSVRLASGREIAADAVLISTKAAAPGWFSQTDFPRNALGFLLTRPTLQLDDDDDVFAVGDCASVSQYPREKSGVFAVRQGPVIAGNLRRRALGQAAKPFAPQQRFLTLVSLGDKRAIAARGPFAAVGPWAWKWKDRIDRAFMDKFNVLPVMSGAGDGGAGESAMRCGGCAAKVGPVTLSAALDRLDGLTSSSAIVTKPPRDDAAIIDEGSDTLRLETIDFFKSFWLDPYVFGEIAANHAMNDIFAMGGRPKHAQAIAVLPHAKPHIVENDLFQLLAGAKAAFDREGVDIIGGHSSEGTDLSIGFAISGNVGRQNLRPKNGLNAGDCLILTRPIGTGILFAANMRGLASAGAIEVALASMRQSNRRVAEILIEHGATAMTDVTGFGLAGHLIEMLNQSHVAATLDLDRLPFYPTVTALARQGIASTLLTENTRMAGAALAALPPEMLAVLFDPQTSGGLLAGMPAASAQACVEALRTQGAPQAVIIGAVTAAENAAEGTIDVEGQLRQ